MDHEHEVLGAAHGELLAAEDELRDLRVLERHDRAGASQAVAGTGGDRSASPEGALTEVVAKRSARAFFRCTSNFPVAVRATSDRRLRGIGGRGFPVALPHAPKGRGGRPGSACGRPYGSRVHSQSLVGMGVCGLCVERRDGLWSGGEMTETEK